MTCGGTGRGIPVTICPFVRRHPLSLNYPRLVGEQEELQARADEHIWYHTIDLGQGVVTKGLGVHWHSSETFPDFAGRSVLDIGAWDGYYSFLAERKGANRVVALDNYAWGVDFGARTAYWNDCIARGTLPDHGRDLVDFWAPELPGRRGFEFARSVLDSKVEPVLADFATMDLNGIGTFDVVLYLGVLYHMKEPLSCLERVRAVTKEIAVIETEAVHIEGLEGSSLAQFHAGDEVRADFGNWYVPTIEALHSWCRAAGFSTVKTILGPPSPPLETESPRERLGRTISGTPRRPTSAPSANYRAVVHAFP
jgi:tRNA (mo5U34)-methyltransferase